MRTRPHRTGSSGYHPLDEIIASTFANNISVVSLATDLRFTRFLRFKFGEVSTTTLLAEIEVFGRGYPQEARYISAPHSFGQAVSLGRVTWKFTRYRLLPSGAITADPTAPVQLNLQTRAGFDDNPKTFFIFDDLGRLVEVDEKTYFDSPRVVERFSEGIAGFRAKRDDDIENWNNWSVNYQASGDEIRSSDGAEFLQFRFTITTEDPLAFGVLDSLAFEVSPLLADRALAEIALDGRAGVDGAVEVPLGVAQRFAYHIRTEAGTTDRAGFDGIELEVPPGTRFLDLTIDDQPATEDEDFFLAANDGRLRFTFPTAFQEDKAFRVRFQSAVFQPSVFLASRLFKHLGGQLAAVHRSWRRPRRRGQQQHPSRLQRRGPRYSRDDWTVFSRGHAQRRWDQRASRHWLRFIRRRWGSVCGWRRST